jgi:hypothetical protein
MDIDIVGQRAIRRYHRAMLARPLVALALSSAVVVSAAQASAQSLGSRLGAPSGDAAPSSTPATPSQATPSQATPSQGTPSQATPAAPPAASPPAGRPTPRQRDLFVRASAPSYSARERSSAPPDVVLTYVGGMLRGTIVRSEPGRSVVVQLPTGEVREVPWGNVRFAGPTAEAPAMNLEPPVPAPPAPTTVAASPGIRVTRGAEVHIRFVSDQRLTLHNVGATALGSASVPGSWMRVSARADRWDRICTAPCELDIQPGQYRFGVSINGRGPFRGPLVDIRTSGELHGHYVDNGGLRAAGWVVFILGLAAGGGGVTFGIFNGGDLALIVPGAILGGVALIAGIPMMAAGNGVVFRFE